MIWEVGWGQTHLQTHSKLCVHYTSYKTYDSLWSCFTHSFALNLRRKRRRRRKKNKEKEEKGRRGERRMKRRKEEEK